MATAIGSEVTLGDGSHVHIRPIRPEDDQVLIQIFKRLSPQSVYQRFHAPISEMSPAMASRFSHVDYDRRMALIAERVSPDAAEVIAVGRYEPLEPDMAELALVVLDEWQNRGLGKIMLQAIIEAAQKHGFRRFRADVLAENRRMMHLLTQIGDVYERKIEGTVTSLFFRPRVSG